MKEVIYVALFTFVLKLFDNTFGTIKNIQLNKERYFGSSLSNSLSTLFYFIAVAKAPKTDGLIAVAATSACIATFLGTYIPAKFMKKREPDKLFKYDITSDTLENGLDFVDAIIKNNIPIKHSVMRDNDKKRVISCKVYSSSKEESSLVENLMPKTFKFTIDVPIAS